MQKSSTKIPVTKHRVPASGLLDFPDLRISLSTFAHPELNWIEHLTTDEKVVCSSRAGWKRSPGANRLGIVKLTNEEAKIRYPRCILVFGPISINVDECWTFSGYPSKQPT